MLIHSQKAIPGYSLFSYNLQTKETKFVSKIEFTIDELRQGVKKEYTYFSGIVIYMQEKNLKAAKKKFKQFINYKYGKQNEVRNILRAV